VLWSDGEWIVIDFEGEPARPITDRRRKRSPLRDAAGMLRSFAYAAAAYELRTGRPAPAGWLERTRGAFLDRYLPPIEALGLVPSGRAAEELLGIFELEKAVYELRYELGHRPDWVGIAVAGIQDLLE
jgi:predicted trehalose synthase